MTGQVHASITTGTVKQTIPYHGASHCGSTLSGIAMTGKRTIIALDESLCGVLQSCPASRIRITNTQHHRA